MNIIQDQDISLNVLHEKTVAVIGYGNQGRPQALNLKDSEVQTVVGLREHSPRWTQVQSDGLTVDTIENAVKQSQVIMMLLPDEAMGSVYQNHIEPVLQSGSYIGFAHGMALLYQLVQPQESINAFLMAPKAHGMGVRNNYLSGKGALGLVSVHQDPSGDTQDVALAYGKAIGCGMAGILETTLAEETETNHFGEQVVLCGGLSQLCKTAFEVLVEAGYSPEVAYYECLHEVKLLADLLHNYGIVGMHERISHTALYGDLTQGPKTIDGHVRESMRHILADVQSGKTVQRFLEDVSQGSPTIKTRMHADYEHLIEQTGRSLREAEVL